MTRYVTLTYVLAPVAEEVLERAEALTVLGDSATEIDEHGMSTASVSAPENLMGAIFAQWHDDDLADTGAARKFVHSFSTSPVEVRTRRIEDPHYGPGRCGRHFQNDSGDTFVYDGFLLIRPMQDDLEEFFVWADRIFQ